MKQFRKFVSGALTLATSLSLSGVGMVSNAYAAPLTESRVELSDSRGAVSSTYAIKFKVAQTTAVKGFKFTFSNRASGSVTVPDSWAGGSATLASLTRGGSSFGSFTINTTGAASGILYAVDGANATANSAGNEFVVTFDSITNNSATVSGGNECDTIANSDTCYVRIETHNTEVPGSMNSGTLIDSATTSYTVVAPVTVTATVDPSLTFTVAAVTNTDIATNDANATCANAVTTTATTIPFGNLGVGISNNRCGQHSLAVATNAAYGYDVYMKFRGAAAASNTMEGTISGNNIDIYTGTYGTPTAFSSSPSGVAPNVNSGWIGYRATDIGAFTGANLYAGPTVNTTSAPGDSVLTNSGPDLGSTPAFVTYKIAVNALQPADSYTGTAVYNVVARY